MTKILEFSLGSGDRARLKSLTARYREQTSPRWLEDGHEDVVNEAYIDVRGMAQIEVLFDGTRKVLVHRRQPAA